MVDGSVSPQGRTAMRRFQEFKGQSTRLDYNRERGEFVARPVPHPFVVRSAASEVKTEPTSWKYALSLQHQTGPVLEPTRSRAFSLQLAPLQSLSRTRRGMNHLPVTKIACGPQPSSAWRSRR